MAIQIVDNGVPGYEITGNPGYYYVTRLRSPKTTFTRVETLEAAFAIVGREQAAYTLREIQSGVSEG